MLALESQWASSPQVQDHDIFSSDPLPIPHFLINDPHSESWTPYILEDGVSGFEENELMYNDYLSKSASCQQPIPTWSSHHNQPCTSNSTLDVSVTLQRLIEHQSQLISKAFESWRSKYPIRSDPILCPSLTCHSHSKRSHDSRAGSRAGEEPDHADEHDHTSVAFDLWAMNRSTGRTSPSP